MFSPLSWFFELVVQKLICTSVLLLLEVYLDCYSVRQFLNILVDRLARIVSGCHCSLVQSPVRSCPRLRSIEADWFAYMLSEWAFIVLCLTCLLSPLMTCFIITFVTLLCVYSFACLLPARSGWGEASSHVRSLLHPGTLGHFLAGIGS